MILSKKTVALNDPINQVKPTDEGETARDLLNFEASEDNIDPPLQNQEAAELE